MLAASVPLRSEGRGWLGGGRGWRGSVPPQGQLQGLFGKQRLDQGQVQARNAAAIQHQDLIAWTQTCEQGSSTFRGCGGGNTGGGGIHLNQPPTFVKSRSLWKNLADKNPAVSLAVYVSCYRKALWETRQIHRKH